MRFLTALLIFGVLGQAAHAQDEQERFLIGQDAFVAGQTIRHETPGADDLFIAGQTVRVEAPVDGTVHAIGQSVRVEGTAGGNVYALGQDVRLSGEVAGNASVAGQTVQIDGTVDGNLRAAGATIEVAAPVAGYAILAGQSVELDAEIAGDVSLSAETAEFGPGAVIGGTLTLYEREVGEMDVPDRVIATANVTRVELEEWDHEEWDFPGPDRREIVARFIGGVIMMALLASLTAALMPERLADMRRTILATPGRMLGIGFLTESALIGAVFLVAITLIGLLFVPAILLLAGLVFLAGYVIAAYSFGVGLILLIGRDEPDDLLERVVAAGIGALSAGIIGAIPVLGWIFVLGLSLAGIGAIVQTTWGTPTLSGPEAG